MMLTGFREDYFRVLRLPQAHWDLQPQDPDVISSFHWSINNDDRCVTAVLFYEDTNNLHCFTELQTVVIFIVSLHRLRQSTPILCMGINHCWWWEPLLWYYRQTRWCSFSWIWQHKHIGEEGVQACTQIAILSGQMFYSGNPGIQYHHVTCSTSKRIEGLLNIYVF